ncbi:hypothetical protein F511_35711 [Dorcoceras hygrometricum]|uniref:Uncharacterized protein n=1 Tax=Dorcoceras hygrometricum TaxID=472368 RepID=A0A2Z7AGG1_9LAMI|nr:hypothetical protein F511_35711 [Dorcoceras hygrometricum]
MQAHPTSRDDDMCFVFADGPIKVMRPNTVVDISAGETQWVEKPIMECTTEDKKKANLDNVAKDILYKTLENNMFSKIQTCVTTKDVMPECLEEKRCRFGEVWYLHKLSQPLDETWSFWRKLVESYQSLLARCCFTKTSSSVKSGNPDVNLVCERVSDWIDDVSYAMSFELVGTQRFDATTDCPAFGFETSRGFVVSAGLTSRGNTRRRFDL